MSRRLTRRSFLAIAGAAGLGAVPVRGALGAIGEDSTFPGASEQVWVRSAGKPKMRLDDAIYSRFDKRHCVFPSSAGGSLAAYVGPEAERAMAELSRGAAVRLQGRPGFRPRDRALVAAARTVIAAAGGSNSANRGLMSWTSAASPAPPDPTEESNALETASASDPVLAARDVKAAARLFGASLVGVARLDRRHFYSYDLDGKSVVFENVAAPYETADRRVIPERCRSVVVYAVRMSSETVKRAPTALGTASANVAYSQLAMVGASLATFIRTLGYTAIPCINDTAVSIPLAVEAGLGELGRHNRMITPEYGPMVRLGKVITDLPLAADQPIDAGIKEFCRSCSKCAEACPSGAISSAPEPTMTTRGLWNNPGHEAWFEDSVKCYSYTNTLNTTCMICFSVCPFSKKDHAAIHRLVKATIATTDILDGVIRSVDDAFGYGGQKSPDGWWELDLPPFGID